MLYKAVLFLIVILLATTLSYDIHAQTQTSVKLLKTFGYLDSEQHFVVFGEVENQGGTVQFVEVIAQFFDQELKPLTSVSGSIAIERLHAGQISPFVIRLDDPNLAKMVRTFTVSIGNFNPAEEKQRKLDIISHKVETSEDTITVSGRIANDGSSTSDDTKVMVVLYNPVGEPVRFVSAFTDPRNVLPFSSGTFSLKMDVRDIGTISGYAIYGESSAYTETKRVVKMQSVTMERHEETVNLTELTVLDQNNQLINSANVGEPILFTISVTSNGIERQQYMYILQIKDQNGYVLSLSWVIDSLDVRESSSASIAWVAEERGTYQADAFVWKNLDEAVPLSFRTLNKTFQAT